MDQEPQPTKPVTRRLDHLPIIGQALTLQTLRIREFVDARLDSDPRSHVTTGQCIEALIVAILLGKHTLYRVDELLGAFDLEVALGWGFEAERLNDTRLGKALEDFFVAGPSAVHASVVVRAVDAYLLDLSRLHFDTTTARVFGEYAQSKESEDPEEPGAVPHITYGHSKDHRPDLKQILIGVTATADGPVPIAGRAASGNRADGLECEYTLRDLAHLLPDPSTVTLVADSKFFSGRRLEIVDYLGLGYITLLPRSVGIWDEAFDEYRRRRERGGEIPVLKRREGRSKKDPDDEWKGLSFDMTYMWNNKEEKEKELIPIPVRLVVVQSSALRRKKQKSLERKKEAEAKRLEKKILELTKREFHCAADAEAEAETFRGRTLRFHSLEVAVRWENMRVKRDRPGRPKKGETSRHRRVWRVDVDVLVVPDAFEQALLNESCFVLSTNLPREGQRAHSDAEILEAYGEQHTVEGCMRWAKGPLAVAPLFLKSPDRIAALIAIYILALMVYGLIQREIRRQLKAENTTMPGNRGQGWTNKPTAEVLFRLFERISTVRGLSGRPTLVTNMNTEQVRVLRLLRCPLLSNPRVTIVEPSEPKPGDRAWKPKPRAPKK